MQTATVQELLLTQTTMVFVMLMINVQDLTIMSTPMAMIHLMAVIIVVL